MGALASSIRLFFSRNVHPSATPPGNETAKPSSALLDLPVEMMQYIASFLPTGSAAALALCNHSSSRTLGTQYWEKLRKVQPREREEFLLMLERDLPDFLFCHRCAKLHLPDDRRTGAIPRKEERPCFQADFWTGTYRYFHHGFRFEHVQMIMKRHRLGLDISAHLHRLSITETGYRQKHNYQFSMEARVISGELLVRAQHWMLIPAGHNIEMPRIDFAYLCPHLESPVKEDYLWKLLRCTMDHLNSKEDSCPTCTGLKQCRFCLTEFQIDVKDFGTQGTAIVITRWLDLGIGETPTDPKWLSHFRYCGRGKKPEEWRFEFGAGSIKSAFEQHQSFFFDSIITSGSIQKLLRR